MRSCAGLLGALLLVPPTGVADAALVASYENGLDGLDDTPGERNRRHRQRAASLMELSAEYLRIVIELNETGRGRADDAERLDALTVRTAEVTEDGRRRLAGTAGRR